jgi:ribosomal protein L40E
LIALLVGTALAVTSLLYVLFPLLRVEVAAAARTSRTNLRPQNSAVDSLRELEFDRETGKISDADYAPLKARYTEQALVVLRAGNAPVCEVCGPRPQPDAQFCSNCGSVVMR